MIIRRHGDQNISPLLSLLMLLCFVATTCASLGDRLPEFRQCVSVSLTCAHRSFSQVEYVRSAWTRTAVDTMQLFVSLRVFHTANDADPQCSSSPPPPVLLDLPGQLRLCLPAHHHRPSCRPRSSHARANRTVSRQMAFLPPPRHPRALFRPVLALQFPGAPERIEQDSG